MYLQENEAKPCAIVLIGPLVEQTGKKMVDGIDTQGKKQKQNCVIHNICSTTVQYKKKKKNKNKKKKKKNKIIYYSKVIDIGLDFQI